ncbi:Lipoprotein releasing system ATP-binding protein LolD [Croceitalea dokdonensis DOKDO 023]|uniref:Lipoprotein releasing system ATP-binding protein LolD n=1 Tax=Croceitalea dokdonensis DOKDO 023 TaxID=1300341 RepID=A0A0N8H3J5_9FLAO|nr:ATP-binding cassette domain-containing protein [Croceitalea dokdonensis]KPM30748.1 Lipoprotein releasing system ATP-binding protein LolD [Croceitalea dokdonensis DOKDO 023]
MSDILQVEKVSKRFGGHAALTQVSLTIPENCIYGLLGPNGAGKTTLIRIINQITHPDEGKVYFQGQPLAPEHISHIGYLPEERGLYKSMKVGEQALYLAQLKGLSKKEAKIRLDYWFKRLDIGDWWNKKIQELSKGMAQKIQFIVTVLHKPKLLIFDEPFSGFDPINANKIKDEILALKEQGTSIIFSTHRMESVEELCDHIALIHKSEKILDGKLSEVKNAYKNNKYRIELHLSDRSDAVIHELRALFEISDEIVIDDTRNHTFTLRLPNGDTTDFLRYLHQNGIHLKTFQEIIPSTNEIFIKTINQKMHA